MYYRMVLKQGMSLLNMCHVREVAIRGPVLTICYPPTTDGRSWGHGQLNVNQEYTFKDEDGAKAEFEKIQAFLEDTKVSSPLG
jgi:hypothetical protein